jgi:hypothetical protein
MLRQPTKVKTVNRLMEPKIMVMNCMLAVCVETVVEYWLFRSWKDASMVLLSYAEKRLDGRDLGSLRVVEESRRREKEGSFIVRSFAYVWGSTKHCSH